MCVLLKWPDRVKISTSNLLGSFCDTNSITDHFKMMQYFLHIFLIKHVPFSDNVEHLLKLHAVMISGSNMMLWLTHFQLTLSTKCGWWLCPNSHTDFLRPCEYFAYIVLVFCLISNI
jgi:hypothetical protein